MGISRSENMRRIRSKDTAPEMAVRRLVHSMGYRYRLHRRDIPGKPDLVFPGRRKVIFIHGCFWHQHPGCREGRPPKSNTAYWVPKLERNKERDQAAYKQLAALGWDTLVVWECETHDVPALAEILTSFLERVSSGEPSYTTI
ncbi:DNA mismatch endonuclease Vsr [Azospirillum brasilense]|uniref:very short patch repair endonuclease n=1 Tax=Azospirillum argentinense TaxID=2970906 RepID=UPI0024953D0E|nr:DNA mismatch endonuclease Vsr [Azospirillum argentinense]MBK3801833.1 DNA mismatch endonuclease Vsr [Azospirillum argentinense]